MLGHCGPPLRRVVGVVATETEHVARGVRNGSEEPHALEWVDKLALGQVLDGLLLNQPLAVLPRFAGEGERGLAPLDQLEQAPRKAPAPPPDGPALDGQLLG